MMDITVPVQKAIATNQMRDEGTLMGTVDRARNYRLGPDQVQVWRIG
jgi:hypothetical protein